MEMDEQETEEDRGLVMSKMDSYINLLNRHDVHNEEGARNLLFKYIPEKWLDDIIEDLKKLEVIVDESKVEVVEPEPVEDYSDNPLRDTFKKGMTWVFKRKGTMRDGKILMKKFDFIKAVSIDLKWFSYADGELFFESMETLGLAEDVGDGWYGAKFNLDEIYEKDCLNGAWDFMDEMGLERGADAKKIIAGYKKETRKIWKRWEKENEDTDEDVEGDKKEDESIIKNTIIKELSKSTGIDKKVVSECFDYHELNYGLNRDFFFEDLRLVGREKELKVLYGKLSEVFAIG